MAQMTRADMRTELTNRGWSRFVTADLNRYLDFGLRDVTRELKWKDNWAVQSIAGQATGTIAYSAINSGNLRSVKRVYVKTVGKERWLEPMEDEEFFQDWLYRDLTSSTNKGDPAKYYIYQDKIYLIPVPDLAVDIDVHYVTRLNAFTGDVVSGLSERLDEAILAAAEAYCFRRAHELDNMLLAQNEMRRICLAEIVEDAQEFEEQVTRAVPYR